MSAGSPVPVQVFQGLSKGKLFGEVETSFAELAQALEGNGARQGKAARAAAERDALLMEHLPTVRYVARRIHERLPQHVDLDDLISAGVVVLIDAFSKFDQSKK